jgi:histidine triad (HIT) family protein
LVPPPLTGCDHQVVNDRIFCEIVAGRLPSYRLPEDDQTMAFLDIRPASQGHALVVPGVHVRDVWEISELAHGR